MNKQKLGLNFKESKKNTSKFGLKNVRMLKRGDMFKQDGETFIFLEWVVNDCVMARFLKIKDKRGNIVGDVKKVKFE